MRGSACQWAPCHALARIVREQLTSSSLLRDNPKMTRGMGGPLFIWHAQVGTTLSELQKLIVPMREVRKLWANYMYMYMYA